MSTPTLISFLTMQVQATGEILALVQQREAIVQAIRDYHYAIDMREYSDRIAEPTLDRIADILDIPWVQGAERKRREESK